ncbi:putative spliceosomal protein sap [Baffinella frigidus]|nr:putative spliceosomal protein sap [Cryptophyta sp. CCMP2293]
MNLYALTLEQSAAVTCTATGSFASPGQQEVAVAHGKTLELLRLDADGKTASLCTAECFGIVRSMTSLRLPGANVDLLVVGSDAGRMVVLQYCPVQAKGSAGVSLWH